MARNPVWASLSSCFRQLVSVNQPSKRNAPAVNRGVASPSIPMNNSSTNCDNASYLHKDEPNCENEPPSNMPWLMSGIGKAIRHVTSAFGKISLIYVAWQSFIISMSLPDWLMLLKPKPVDLVTDALVLLAPTHFPLRCQRHSER